MVLYYYPLLLDNKDLELMLLLSPGGQECIDEFQVSLSPVPCDGYIRQGASFVGEGSLSDKVFLLES